MKEKKILHLKLGFPFLKFDHPFFISWDKLGYGFFSIYSIKSKRGLVGLFGQLIYIYSFFFATEPRTK